MHIIVPKRRNGRILNHQNHCHLPRQAIDPPEIREKPKCCHIRGLRWAWERYGLCGQWGCCEFAPCRFCCGWTRNLDIIGNCDKFFCDCCGFCSGEESCTRILDAVKDCCFSPLLMPSCFSSSAPTTTYVSLFRPFHIVPSGRVAENTLWPTLLTDMPPRHLQASLRQIVSSKSRQIGPSTK